MNICINFIRILFVFFLIYTVTYLIQWGIGLCVSIQRLSKFQENKRRIARIMPNSIARNFPVSVIIPAHNEQNCICDTIDSLLHDDYPNLRIIVVDDGSTDQTAQQILDSFELEEYPVAFEQALSSRPISKCFRAVSTDREIVLICKENGGKSDALNCGLNACQTPYCVVLDADTQVTRGAIRIMASQFLLNSKTVVCAGSIGSNFKKQDLYPHISFFHKCLLRFQQLEYFRTFYMQRILFEQVNANVIVSGAFAMFDTALLKSVGGYRVNTIGEDMEITMRLHAFCLSQKRPYRIAYAPEAQCYTQFPFHYGDFIRQRRRWHIGMIQSFQQHLYMLGNSRYGWAGFITSSFLLIYEFLSPFIEFAGILTLIAAHFLNLLDFSFAWKLLLIYILLSILNQRTLIHALRAYHVVEISFWDRTALTLIALLESVTFHPLNVIVKIFAIFMRGHRRSWEDIRRTGSDVTSQLP